MKADILIVDGRHALWRTSDAFKMLSAEVDGQNIGTGGMYGFLCLMIRIHQKYGGKIIVAWEGLTNFRHNLYPQYKAKSEVDEETMAMIQDMRAQEKRLKAMLRLLGVQQYYGKGCEADDVIGRLSLEYSNRKKFVLIYSGDSDLRQLVTENVMTVSPGYGGGKDTIYDQERVLAKHGVVPGYISDFKALSGDTSDNVPGLKGIGAKSAAKLINAYGGVDDVIRGASGKINKEWPLSERFKDVVLSNIDELLLYKKLTTIYRDMPMIPIEPKPDKSLLLKHFKVYHFASLMASGEMHELMKLSRQVETQ